MTGEMRRASVEGGYARAGLLGPRFRLGWGEQKIHVVGSPGFFRIHLLRSGTVDAFQRL